MTDGRTGNMVIYVHNKFHKISLIGYLVMAQFVDF